MHMVHIHTCRHSQKYLKQKKYFERERERNKKSRVGRVVVAHTFMPALRRQRQVGSL